MEIEKPLRKKSVSLRRLDDECLLYDGQADKLHVVNEAAGFVWGLCDGSRSVRDIEGSLRDAYRVPDEVDLSSDVRHILVAFADLELLQLGVVEGQ
jgi:Coenzyme PQQ synthesis protein D (PqqD)